MPYDLRLTVRSPTLPPQIRFTRLGRIRTPFYRIIAIDSRKRRDGAPLEVRAAPARGPDEKPPPVSPFASLDRWTNRKKWIAGKLERSTLDRRSERLAHLAPPSFIFTNRSLDGTTLSRSSRTSTPPPSRRGWRRARSPRTLWARFSGSPSSWRSKPRRRLFRGVRPARHGHGVSS